MFPGQKILPGGRGPWTDQNSGF